MKNSQSRIKDYRVKDNQNSTIKDESFKTTDINILLNRVKIEKKINSKKKLVFSISIISIVSFISVIVLGN